MLLAFIHNGRSRLLHTRLSMFRWSLPTPPLHTLCPCVCLTRCQSGTLCELIIFALFSSSCRHSNKEDDASPDSMKLNPIVKGEESTSVVPSNSRGAASHIVTTCKRTNSAGSDDNGEIHRYNTIQLVHCHLRTHRSDTSVASHQPDTDVTQRAMQHRSRLRERERERSSLFVHQVH